MVARTCIGLSEAEAGLKILVQPGQLGQKNKALGILQPSGVKALSPICSTEKELKEA